MEAETFTHLDPNIQVFAAQGNVEAEESLNLVHTTTSMLRVKDDISTLPPILVDEDFVHPDDEGSWSSEEEAELTLEEQLDIENAKLDAQSSSGAGPCGSGPSTTTSMPANTLPPWYFEKDTNFQSTLAKLILQTPAAM